MFNHAKEGDPCFICPAIQGNHADVMIQDQDRVYSDDLVTVFMNSFFLEGNEGHLIVVPNEHIENLYDLTPEVGERIMEVVRDMAIALKEAYKCDGITLRQNNEPAADQHAFHFHMHIFPRYEGDLYNANSMKKIKTEPEDRKPYLDKLKAVLEQN